jgi:ferredoxin-NADP reductase
MNVRSIPKAPLKFGRRLFSSGTVEWLVTPHSLERYTELVNPLWARTQIRARVASVERQTAHSVTLTLKPNSNWKGFTAGSHIPVIVEVDGVSQLRFYSPANADHQRDRVELTVTAHEGGVVSNHFVEHAQPGMLLRIGDAENDFALPAGQRTPLLLISGGSGITPMMSMLRTLLHERSHQPIAFLHYARTPDETLYREELRRLANRHDELQLAFSFTRESPGEQHLTGHLTRRHLKALGVDPAAAQTYVCGPPGLIAATEKLWAKDGLSERLHIERFVLPEIATDGEATGTLRFTASGVEVENSGEPILAQAEQAGLTPWAGCRLGICHTCVADVGAGAVRDVRTGEVYTVENEKIQICIHAPVGDLNIDL